MTQTSPQKQRGSEALWLSAALDILTCQGVEAVKVMPLAKSLGLSRTSFYWHFEDRDALLEAMIQTWEAKNTGNLVARCNAPADTITEAIFNLFDCWLDRDLFDSPLDLAIRNWARNDPALQLRLDRADALRRDAIRAMYLRFGFPEEQADARAGTAIYTQIGYISMQVDESLTHRVDRMPGYVEVYTGQPADAENIARFRARHLSNPGTE